MDQSAFRALLHRYQQGNCTPAEKRRVEEWYGRLGSEQSLELTPPERAELVATVWQRITDQTTASYRPAALPTTYGSQAAHGRTTWARGNARWAAVALLAVGAGVGGAYLERSPAKGDQTAPTETANWLVYANASAHDARVALPDGSAIVLSPASTLKYPRTFRGPRRAVYLTGAAQFDVFHDATHPFLVYTDQVVTTVLGTSFRVAAYPGQPEVQVQVRTGKVQVSARPDPAGAAAPGLLVLPNQQAVYSAARRQLRRELVAQPALLAPRSFVFNDRPVAEVLAALERAYGVTIAYDAAALRACTINLSLGNEPLFDKLDVLCETLGATYEKADGRILFHSPPCQVE